MNHDVSGFPDFSGPKFGDPPTFLSGNPPLQDCRRTAGAELRVAEPPIEMVPAEVHHVVELRQDAIGLDSFLQLFVWFVFFIGVFVIKPKNRISLFDVLFFCGKKGWYLFLR